MTTRQLLAKPREGKLGFDCCYREATATKTRSLPLETTATTSENETLKDETLEKQVLLCPRSSRVFFG
jgi:hypothetical protein